MAQIKTHLKAHLLIIKKTITLKKITTKNTKINIKIILVLYSKNPPTLGSLVMKKKLEDIVNEYKIDHQKNSESELQWFSNQKTLSNAVSQAALALKENGKKCDHQRRIKKPALEDSEKKLIKEIKKIEQLKNKNFDGLHNEVGELIGGIKGIGELTIYDTALRIGAKLKLEPKKVYLHAGTRVGAKN